MISFTKLNDGTWGIKSNDRHLAIGDVAVVTRRDGSTKSVTVTGVVSRGRSGGIYAVSTAAVPTQYALASLQQQSRASAARLAAADRAEVAAQERAAGAEDDLEYADAMGEVWHAQYE